MPFYAYGQEGGKFRFAVIGCAHLGVCSHEELESAVEKIKGQKPDFVLFLGGMVDSSSDEPVESLWHTFDSIIAKLGVPVYDIPSNCRLSGLSISDDKTALMDKYFLDRYKKHYYSFEYENNLFIGLDSENLAQGKGNDFEGQVKFLRNALADASKYSNVFIFTHASPWFHNDTSWNKVIHPLINGKVKVVFGAQDHTIEARRNKEVTYITTGVPPCYVRRHSSKVSFPNFLIVEVEKDNVSVRVIPLNTIPIESLGALQPLDKMQPESLNEVVKPYRLTSYEREVLLAPKRVIEVLKIRPGMDILDLGAGSGLFTFRFADALKGTGRVFATDIDPNLIEFIKNKAEESGRKNVFPVRVKPQVVDFFYKQHSFDVIFLSEAYQYLRYPEDYFRKLLPSLKSNGRLYIIHAKNIYDFTEIEIGDFKNIVKTLASKDDNFPVFKKLDKDVKYFIKHWQGEDITPGIRQKIVNNLNRMLLDRWLFNDLMDYFASKGIVAGEGEWSAPLKFILLHRDQDIRLVKWLYVDLDADGVFDKKENPLSAVSKEQLSKLNKILLCDILATHRIDSLQGEFVFPIYVKKESIISTMDKSGYQFVSEYDFLPINYLLEFKRK
jgi:ubiquinone/menaquinone biosynthesis C-methylase UbiE